MVVAPTDSIQFLGFSRNLVRLPHGEIVLFWNNCLEPLPREGAWIYAGRDALHAALSPDEGKTWPGSREVCLDPLRNQSRLAGMGDRGAAYGLPL